MARCGWAVAAAMLCLLSSVSCFQQQRFQLSSLQRKYSIQTLRGGGFLDKRTPVYWPTFDEEEIPEDGSIGGHYSLEEVCGESVFIGEASPWPAFAGIVVYLVVISGLMAWLNLQPWVPELL